MRPSASTPPSSSRVARRLVAVVDPEGEDRRDEKALDREERAAHLNRHLSISDDGAGGAWIKGRCSSEDAATLKTTLIPLAKPEPANGPVCDPADLRGPRVWSRRTRPPRPRRPDARRPHRAVPPRPDHGPAARVPRRHPTGHRHREPRGPGPGVRVRHHRDRRRPHRRHGAADVLRRRHHPRRPRVGLSGPRRGSHPTTGHRGDLESPRRQRPALPLQRAAPGRR